MIAKILTTKHSGVNPGDIGTITEDLGSGYAIRCMVRKVKLFGGGDDTKEEAVIYFPKGEVQLIDDDQVDPMMVAPEEACTFKACISQHGDLMQTISIEGYTGVLFGHSSVPNGRAILTITYHEP